jgi:hypothetical protein
MQSQIQGKGSISLEEVYSKLKQGSQLESKVVYSHPNKTDNKTVRMSLGRVWFNELLPEDFRLIDEPVDKEVLNKIIKELYNKYEPEKTSDIIGIINTEGFKMATIVPNSFTVDTLIPPDDWLDAKKIFAKKWQNVPPDKMDMQKFTKEADALTKKLLVHFKKKGFKLQNILDSGARGNALDDWKALLVAKGFVIDIEGKISGPITNGTSEGYDTKQYYEAGGQARRNYYYKSTMSAKPGYLSRKVTMANANMVIDKTKKDCGTRKTLDMSIDPNKAKLLIDRFHMVGTEAVKITEADQIKNKKIRLRSPLYCRAKKGICPTCYGDSFKGLDTSNVGILAGGAVNMIGINSMMKMRHKSSQLDLIDVDFDKSLRDSQLDMRVIKKFINIQKKKIIAKTNCTILLDQNEYDESSLIDTGDKFLVPGVLNLYVGDLVDNNFITFPFNFPVELNKPEDYTQDGKTLILRYITGELIISKDYYNKETDPSIINRLLDGSIKYINSPEVLLDAIHDQLPTLDMIYIELILSNMFRTKEDLTVPCRLKDYKNFEIVGVKKLPFINSWLTGLSFEDPNKAIKTALLSGQDADMNPIEKVLLEKFYDQNERNKRDEP